MTLLANVLRGILHRVLLIARVKVSRFCIIVIFNKDYFRQQNQSIAEHYQRNVAELYAIRISDRSEIDLESHIASPKQEASRVFGFYEILLPS